MTTRDVERPSGDPARRSVVDPHDHLDHARDLQDILNQFLADHRRLWGCDCEAEMSWTVPPVFGDGPPAPPQRRPIQDRPQS